MSHLNALRACTLITRLYAPDAHGVEKVVAVLSIVALILIYAPEAGAEQCPRAQHVSVRIIVRMGGVSQSSDIGIAEIRKLAGAQHAARHFPLLGMSVARAAFTIQAPSCRPASASAR